MRQDSGYDYDDLPSPGPRGPNTLGIVGFVLSFCVSPIGLLLSLVALLRAPRGFAVAGVIVGLLGSIIWGVIGAMIYFAGPAFVDSFQIIAEHTAIRRAIEAYKSGHAGALPADLSSGLGLGADELTDPWGTPYRYQLSEDGKSWSITVAGPDGGFDDRETITITSDEAPGEIGRRVGDAFGETLMRRRLGAPPTSPPTTPTTPTSSDSPTDPTPPPAPPTTPD